MKQNARTLSAIILTECIKDKQPLNQVLSKHKSISDKDSSFVQAICYGVMRNYFQLTFIVNALLSKPLPPQSILVQNLLLIGLFQLMHMRVPDHAAIFETVAAAKQLKQQWASKLINGVLRNFQRKQEELMIKVSEDREARTSHPLWLLKVLQTEWPQYYESIVKANNELPPVAIRVNSSNYNPEDIKKIFADSSQIKETSAGLIIDTKDDVTSLKEFANGMFSIQDGASQLAAELLDLKPNQIVLDACAAPGGKTCHMLEIEANIKLTSIEISSSRVKLISQNIERLKLPQPNIKVADACAVDKWWNGVLFDKILLDAPCSATGIIRRQPDIKVIRTEEDVNFIIKHQKKLLESLWPLLKPGGILLYSTCSILPSENEKAMEQFIEKHSDATPTSINLSIGHKLKIGHQILPGENGMDGFYYAKVGKNKNFLD